MDAQKAIAGRMWAKNRMFYVSQVPGDGGADWGYTEKRSEALRLNSYYVRRFVADCRRVGSQAQIWNL